MKSLTVSLVMAALLAATPARAADIGPEALVRATVDDVLAVVRKDKDIQSGDIRKVSMLVEEKVLPHFDFALMTRYAAGKHWRQATPQQQETLVKEFRDLLVRTYTTAFTAYKNQSVEFKPFRMNPTDDDVMVRTAIVSPGQPNAVPVDYAMRKTANGWKVYDVAIEGVSLVTTYRSTFSNEIQKSGIDGLIASLTEKNRAGITEQKKQ